MNEVTPSRSTSQWDDYAEQARAKLPAAPEPLLAGYVRWVPWLAIIFGVFGLLASLALLGLGAILSPFLLLGGASGIQAGAAAFIALAFSLIASGLDLAGGYLMLRRRLTGWWLLAIGMIVTLLNSLLGGSLFGLVITLAFAYIHLQVKPRYS